MFPWQTFSWAQAMRASQVVMAANKGSMGGTNPWIHGAMTLGTSRGNSEEEATGRRSVTRKTIGALVGEPKGTVTAGCVDARLVVGDAKCKMFVEAQTARCAVLVDHRSVMVRK